MAALAGEPVATRTELWQPYELATSEILQAAKPLADLKRRFPSQALKIDLLVADVHKSSDELVYVPLVGRKYFWTVLLDSRNAKVVTFIPLDSF